MDSLGAGSMISELQYYVTFHLFGKTSIILRKQNYYIEKFDCVMLSTHCGLVMQYGTSIWANIGSGYDLLPDGTYTLTEPMLTSH